MQAAAAAGWGGSRQQAADRRQATAARASAAGTARPLTRRRTADACPAPLRLPALSTLSDSWDLSKLSPPASAALSASRLLWSARAAGADASEKLSKGVSDSLSSLTSMEEVGGRSRR